MRANFRPPNDQWKRNVSRNSNLKTVRPERERTQRTCHVTLEQVFESAFPKCFENETYHRLLRPRPIATIVWI